MAEDWIKMRSELSRDPSVIQMSVELDLSEFEIVGMLHHVWSWADQHTSDGHAPSVTKKWIDRDIRCDGFCDAMENAGWLKVSAKGLTFPNFDRHNGQSAKRRAQTTKRKQKQREKPSDSVTQTSRTERDKVVTREEKRREEKEVPNGTSRTKQPLPEIPAALNTAEFGDAWGEWVQHRKEIKKKLTPTAVKQQIAKLSEMGSKRAVAALRFSIRNGYTGIFEEDRGSPKVEPHSGLKAFMEVGDEP